MLYHKIFTVFYFRNVFAAIAGELVSAFFTALILSSILMELLGAAFVAIGTVLAAIFMYACVILFVYMMADIVWALFFKKTYWDSGKTGGIGAHFAKTNLLLGQRRRTLISPPPSYSVLDY